MRRTSPLEIARHPLDHPAARAWDRLGGGCAPTRIEVWRQASRSKPAIYRLTFGRGQLAVYAKRSPTSDLAVERLLYQDILPGLPLTVPRYRGALRDDDGATWMFVESVGDRCISEADPEHRALAARWLATLHGSAAASALATRLPDAGPARYRAHLCAGRDWIRRSSGNRALTARDREVLTGVLRELDGLESRWPRLERACTGLPVTLVHGDFRPKNVRLRFTGGVPTLYALDWEMAGWGIPAADLASGWGHVLTLRIDRRAYRRAVQDHGSDLDLAAMRRLSILGRLFQAVAAVEWTGASLRFESKLHLIRPIGSMRVYRRQIAHALRDGAEWLG
jgi:aminoglycoside phosphotransferase (APT) family kinase protein